MLPISIVVANYNNSIYLHDFFNSIFCGSDHPNEIIFVDDKSTDDSLIVIKDIKAKLVEINLIIVELDENVGFCNALNIGIQHAKNKYIMRIDPDDVIHSDRIKLQYNYLEQNPEISIVGSNVSYFNKNGSLGNSNFPISHSEIVEAYKKGRHGIIHGAVIGRAEVFKSIEYNQQSFPSEEYDIFSRILIAGYSAHNLKNVLTMVRIHDKSVSNDMPFHTVAKKHKLRESLWGVKSSHLKVFFDFMFANNYRKYLSTKGFSRYLYAAIAALFNPHAAIDKIRKFHV